MFFILFFISNVCCKQEVDALLEVNRMSHRLMSEHFEMSSFEMLLDEANERISSDYGQITLHLFSEIIEDFLPSYCYNSSTERSQSSLVV